MQTKITLLTICFIFIFIFTILYFYFLIKEKNNFDYEDIDFLEERDIKQSNKILFYKLRKQYLNNVSAEDIKDLIYFLENELYERKSN